MEEKVRVAPVRRSLTRPRLIFGCDRVPFLFLTLLCIALGLPGGFAAGNYANVVLAIIFFAGGVKVLATLTKYDPDAFNIFKRAMKYNDTYVAASNVLQPDRKY